MIKSARLEAEAAAYGIEVEMYFHHHKQYTPRFGRQIEIICKLSTKKECLSVLSTSRYQRCLSMGDARNLLPRLVEEARAAIANYARSLSPDEIERMPSMAAT